MESLGPDGFHAGFYKDNWGTVGSDVTGVCLRVLNGQESVSVLNDTHIVLIPRIKNPKNVSDFRPISLCNVIYKIITKSLLFGLKLFWDQLFWMSKVRLSLVV